MLQGLEHGNPLVNGYSGFFPQSYWALKAAMTNFPDERSLAHLRESGVVYVVIQKEWLTAERLLRLEARRRQLSLGFSGETKLIYQLATVE